VTLLLKLSQLIDWLNARVAKGAFWLVLVMTLISAANASYRFAFNDSSNGLLRSSGICLPRYSCCAPLHAAKKRARSHRCAFRQAFAARTGHHRHHWQPVFPSAYGHPGACAVHSLVAESYRITEYSANAGGLLRWPVKALLPIGFTLLALQGISELIKRIAFLLG
jgi:hypothetical protein